MFPGEPVTSWTIGAIQTATPARVPQSSHRERTTSPLDRPTSGDTTTRATAVRANIRWLCAATEAVTTRAGHHWSRPQATIQLRQIAAMKKINPK